MEYIFNSVKAVSKYNSGKKLKKSCNIPESVNFVELTLKKKKILET